MLSQSGKKYARGGGKQKNIHPCENLENIISMKCNKECEKEI